MSWADFFSGFLGAFGGVVSAVFALKYLGGKLIEHQLAKALSNHNHELATQLATLQGGMSQLGDVLSRRNEREFTVVERAWELLIQAFGSAQEDFGPSSKPVPVFKITGEAESLKIIDKLSFDDDQKEVLRQSDQDERDELYGQYELQQRLIADHKKWAEFKNYVSTHEIFFSEDIYKAFIQIRDDLYGVIVHVEMFVGDDAMEFSGGERIKVSQDLRDIDKKVSALASVVRQRFGFNEK
jgi:hypothetical protein